MYVQLYSILFLENTIGGFYVLTTKSSLLHANSDIWWNDTVLLLKKKIKYSFYKSVKVRKLWGKISNNLFFMSFHTKTKTYYLSVLSNTDMHSEMAFLSLPLCVVRNIQEVGGAPQRSALAVLPQSQIWSSVPPLLTTVCNSISRGIWHTLLASMNTRHGHSAQTYWQTKDIIKEKYTKGMCTKCVCNRNLSGQNWFWFSLPCI